MKNLKILVPLEGSANSNRTIKKLLSMKGELDCPLTLLHVFDPERVSFRGVPQMNFSQVEERAREIAQQFIEDKKAIFLAEGMEADALLVEGHARKTICELADSGKFDLLIIGRHIEGELRNLIFGQVANFVIHHVKCPVMII